MALKHAAFVGRGPRHLVHDVADETEISGHLGHGCDHTGSLLRAQVRDPLHSLGDVLAVIGHSNLTPAEGIDSGRHLIGVCRATIKVRQQRQSG